MDHHRHLPTVVLGLVQVVVTGTMILSLSRDERDCRRFLSRIPDRKERIMSERWVSIEVERVIRVTDRAILVRVALGDEEYEEVWLPKSQIQDPEYYEEGTTDEDMNITHWLACEKGWLQP